MRKCQECGSNSVRSELWFTDSYSCAACYTKYRVPSFYEWLTVGVVAFFPLLGVYLGFKLESWAIFILCVFFMPLFVQKLVSCAVTLERVDGHAELGDKGME